MSIPNNITVKVGDKDREITMSFGLLNELTTIVNDPSLVPTIPIDPPMRSRVLQAVLAERKKSGKIVHQVDIDDVDISIEDVENTLDWVMSHLVDFFVRALTKVVAVSEASKTKLQALESSLTGLKASTSATP